MATLLGVKNFVGHFRVGNQFFSDSNTAVTGPSGATTIPTGWSGNYFDSREDQFYIATVPLSSTITNTTEIVKNIELTIKDFLLAINDNSDQFATDRIFAYPVLKETEGSTNTYYPNGGTSSFTGGSALASFLDSHMGATKRNEIRQFISPNYEIDDKVSEMFPIGTTPSSPYSFNESGLTAFQTFNMSLSYMTGWDGVFKPSKTYSIQIHYRVMTSNTATTLGHSGNTYGSQQFVLGFNTADIVTSTITNEGGFLLEGTAAITGAFPGAMTSDPIVATNDISKQQTTAFRKPQSMDRVTDGGGSALFYKGTFLSIANLDAASLKKFVDPGYVDDYTSDPEPLSVDSDVNSSRSNGTRVVQTPKLFFDFAELREIATTTIDQVTFKITVTVDDLYNPGSPFASVSTGKINVQLDNFATDLGIDNTLYGGSQTITAGQQSTHTFTCTNSTHLAHSGTFLPIAVVIDSDKIGKWQIDSVECQVKYTGKTMLKGDYVKNDTLGYTQTAGDGSTVKPGEKQGRLRDLDGSATDQISFNWNAGRFATPDNSLVVQGIQLTEYIQMTRGQGFSTSFPYAASFFTSLETGGIMNNLKVENAQYTMTQDGSDKGNVFADTDRDWQVDDGDFSAYFGGAGNRSTRNEIARPNVLSDQTITNIDRADITTAISLKVPFAGADGTALSSGNNQFNMGNEWEHHNATGNSPTGNSAWEDVHSDDRGNFVDDRAPYRSQVLPAATQAYLRFLFAPSILGTSNILGTFTKTFGRLGVLHSMESADVGTYTSSFAQAGQGGFLLESPDIAITGAMTFDINAGLQLSVIESESTTATMSFDLDGIRLFITAEATPTTAFALTEDVDLFKGTSLSLQPSFTKTLTQSEIGIILTIDNNTELPAFDFVLTAVVDGDVVPGPDEARIFVFDTPETRQLTVTAQTRQATVAAQTRTAAVNTQTRTALVKGQNRVLTITGYDG